LDELAAAVMEDGYVGPRDLDGRFYDDLRAAQLANATAREKNPEGIDLVELRALWDDVQSETTLDRDFFHPVILDPALLETDELFAHMREVFSLEHTTYVSAGRAAIDDFASATEGPDGDPAFERIARLLRKPSIKKRFYFSGGGDEWSTNILLVLDEHGQMFGMQMGYSE
jgi:hypothetical protein